MFETSPQYEAFIGASRKNTKYTLRIIFLVNWDIKLKFRLDNNSNLRKYYSQDSKTSPQYKAFIGASRKNANYTLRNISPVNWYIK